MENKRYSNETLTQGNEYMNHKLEIERINQRVKGYL